MATVRLSDVIVPAVYQSYKAINNPEKTALFESGVVTRNATLDAIAKAGGKSATLPFWQDLDPNSEPNYSNDDPADKATPEKVGTGTMVCRKAFLNKGYSDMDIVQELAGSSPMQHIRNRFGVYWERQWQRRLLASVVGVMRDNVANDASDMTINIGGGTGAAAIFNSDAVIDAAGTAGDASDMFGAIAIHSKVRDRMLKQDDIEYIADSKGNLTIATYKGKRIILDDSMTKVSGTGADTVYLTILLGTGAFGYGEEQGSAFAIGEGVPRVPVEVDRDPTAGNGGGQETIWERKTQILHPQGFSWDDLPSGNADALVEFSPTLADLAKAVHWNRVVDRKNVPMAFLLSKA